MNSFKSSIVLTEAEIQWIDEQINHFDNHIHNNKALSNYQVKEAYDNFFDGIYELYQKYTTKHLTNMCFIGMEYDGYMPGNNANFIALYEELINKLRDKTVDKPIRYYAEIHEELVLMEEDEDGNKTIVNKKNS
ncbi:hypothetical protein [Bacillus thuringiensis]|uniref:hypothetical protein n=1 Tax=Bacillus thuringiensis TaxID=1428 RepID=UPI0021D69107|nr:hypothetical protein [Bacillus thuringiensis]MCU7667996.1 hypothetical protein [Bacillus thuringiensis]